MGKEHWNRIMQIFRLNNKVFFIIEFNILGEKKRNGHWYFQWELVRKLDSQLSVKIKK